MSKKARKPRQLSEKEVYRDAAKILEEILETKLGRKSIDSSNTNNTAHSSSGYYDASGESLDIWLKDDNYSHNFNIERSQTMPSSFKLEEKDDFIEQDIKEYMKTKSDFAHRRHSGSATSDESDDLDTRIGPTLRRKKSFMKRAKERLSISFRRDRGNEREDILEKPEQKERKKKKKKKNKDKDDINQNKKYSKIEENGDDGFGSIELRHPNRKRSDSTTSKRSSFIDSIRKSFRSKRKSTTIYESLSADAIVDKKGKDRNSINRPTAVIEVPDTEPILPTNKNSVIDLDDIKYMDEDECKPTPRNPFEESDNERDVLPKPKVNRRKPAPPPPVATPIGMRHPLDSGHTGSALSVNDEVDSPTKKENDVPFTDRSDSEKDDIFEKIAVRLIEMADVMEKIKTETDTTDTGKCIVVHTGSGHSSSVDPDLLTPLEQELLECLRVGGDRLSLSGDDPVQVLITKHRQEAYGKFYGTLRKGVGDEMSWNQLSLIYQTAFGAVRAAGAGTQLARRVKDMTQQYVGDIFASWIVKEGGWDSMLSDTESDVN